MAGDVPFADFYARYHPRVLGFATSRYGRDDADDVAQEAMLRAYRYYGHLDPSRDPWPWLAAIVRRVAHDRALHPPPVSIADVPAVSAGEVDIEERAVVRAALGRLSPGDRSVLVLREWHDLSFAELSRLLGRSPNSLRQQAFRARRRLADAYTALGGRALALLGWGRWRGPAAGQVAAAVVTGAVILHGVPAAPPAPPAGPPRPPAAATGPAAHGGTRSGPATGSAAPERPLLPPEATPFPSRPLAGPDHPAARPPDASRPADEPPRRGARATAGKAGYRTAADRDSRAGVLCRATPACYVIAG